MAQNGDGQSGNGSSDARYLIVPGDAMDRILVRLTVVHGNVQIARRRIRRGQASGSDDLDQLLARTEEGTRAMVAEIHAILVATSSMREDTDPDSSET